MTDRKQALTDREWPPARKLELFARRPRAGRATWGNEVDRFVV